MNTDQEKSYGVKLANYHTEAFPDIAAWRGFDSVSAWLSSIAERAIDHEFDCFFEEFPDWDLTAVRKEEE
jgi:hypothetical protein